ncbi:GreA/GreB family elongation factor [Lysobacter sp. 2RAB21]
MSWVSPLARALHGARVGDNALWKRPAGDLNVEVLAIEYG